MLRNFLDERTSRRHGAALFCSFPALALIVALTLNGCLRVEWQARFFTPRSIPGVGHHASFLKCHQKNGELFVLDVWEFDEIGRSIVGKGVKYDIDRNESGRGFYKIPLASIVLFETNRPESVYRTEIAVIGIFTAVSAAVTLACLANPKACFGSCPTFYTLDGDRPKLVAEGFSSSIAKVFEATDIDALYLAKAGGKTFELLMRNEALETHAVRNVSLLYVPRRPGERVFRTAGDIYFPARSLVAPWKCSSMQGDCLESIKSLDGSEYRSPAGEQDLAERESIELVFPTVEGSKGIVIGGRNSLLNTFLFYQVLAYMGTSVGEWITKLEQGDEKTLEAAGGIGKLLGDVDVSVQSRNGEWVAAGSFSEVGPIAREMQLIRLPENLPEGDVRIRLNLTRGNWKLDYVALAALGERVEPISIPVGLVLRNEEADAAALEKLRSPDSYLMTFPGEEYKLRFEIPEGDGEFFLETRGYYYEWMRSQWLTDENQHEVARIFLAPSDALRRLAPAYKKVEEDMESVFWQSKIGGFP